MLVLTRRSGESIVIGGEIRIRVLRATGSRVRLGIEAPADVRIIREKAEEADPPRRPHFDRDGSARNVGPASRPDYEPAARPTTLADRHTALE